MEALRTQIDNLRLEKQQLEVENARLRSDRPEEAAALDAEAEAERLREEGARIVDENSRIKNLYDQLLLDMQEEQARVSESERRVQELENRRAGDAEELERLRGLLNELEATQRESQRDWEHKQRDAELELYRTLEAERKKWEAREDRLVRQLEEANFDRTEDVLLSGRGSRSNSDDATPSRAALSQEDDAEVSGTRESQPPRVSWSPSVTRRVGGDSAAQLHGEARATAGGLPPRTRAIEEEGLDEAGGFPTAPAVPPTAFGLPPTAWSAALLAQQLPPLTKFSGEATEAEGETFRDWKEQFEMVASVCQWDDKAKLANLTTRLRGQAYAFFRSCTVQQKASYQTLVAELTKRFTPI